MMSRGRAAVLAGALGVLACVTSLGNGFAYDDVKLVTTNPYVVRPGMLSGIWSAPYWITRQNGGLYRPLTTLSFAIEHHLHGLAPFYYHATNVVIHAVVSSLVVLVTAGFLPVLAALVAGLLFAVHPVHTEVVANVAGRSELLAALGFLLAWRLYPARTWPRRVFGALAFAAGVLSKEGAIVLPAVLLVEDGLARRKPDAAALGLHALVIACYLAARHHVLGSFGNPKEMILYRSDNVIATLPPGPAFLTALSVFGRYLAKLVVPWPLSADYSWPQVPASGPEDPWVWVGVAGVLSLSWILVASFRGARRPEAGAHPEPARRRPKSPPARAVSVSAAAALGIALFALAFAPVSNFVMRIGTVMAERLLYLPSVGWVILLAAGWQALHSRLRAGLHPLLATATAVLLLAGTAACLARSRDWRDDATLHEVTVRTAPNSARAHFNYGVTLHDRGRADQAMTELNRALALDSTYTEAWVNLAAWELRRGRLEPARAALRRAVAIDSTLSTPYVTLGGLELQAGRPFEAARVLEKAVKLEPGAADAWFNLGYARAATGDTTGAIDALRESTALGLDDVRSHLILARFLTVRRESPDEALRHAQRAVSLKPDAVSREILGDAYFELGRLDEARAAWNEAIRVASPNTPALREKIRRSEVIR